MKYKLGDRLDLSSSLADPDVNLSQHLIEIHDDLDWELTRSLWVGLDKRSILLEIFDDL